MNRMKIYMAVCLVSAGLFVACRNEPAWSPRTDIMEGATNFRDLGGYASANGKQIVWGKVFRSQTLAQLSDRDVEKMRELGIKTVIDFRDDNEVAKAPSRLPEGVKVIRLPIGLGSNDSTQQAMQSLMSGQVDSLQCVSFMEEANRRFATEFASQYKDFFAVLLKKENYPVVFHCTAGKDRTGFAAAMLLSALDVDWYTVMEDYLLTNECLPQQPLSPEQAAAPALRLLWSVQPSYLNAAKDEIIRHYGSINNYLQQELQIGKDEKKQLMRYLLQ